MEDLGIPSYFRKFCKGFLSEKRFRVGLVAQKADLLVKAVGLYQCHLLGFS
jgi:hypothetical protein